ncbi:MAG TPA: hypothetical protein EYP04_07910 [Anaerolineae bacterium]|nr:hypothetical protein [Anaerolineae bacterium]
MVGNPACSPALAIKSARRKGNAAIQDTIHGRCDETWHLRLGSCRANTCRSERDGVRIIIHGHHRAAAAQLAGLKEVPVVVEEVTEAMWNRFWVQVIETMEGR